MGLTAATYQSPTHTLLVNLPSPTILLPQERPALAKVPVHRISITASGVIRWNGIRVQVDKLDSRLDATRAQPIDPFIVFDPDPDAPYATTLSTLARVTAKLGNNPRFCFGELERFRTYEERTPRPRSAIGPGSLPSGCAVPGWLD